jgi:hypothetical protein
MSSSPWDPPDRAIQVMHVDEISIIGVRVCEPDESGRFAIEFETDRDRTLRVKLPAARLRALADVLLALANERDGCDDVHESRELIG